MDQENQVKTNEEADVKLNNIWLTDVIDTKLLQQFQDDFAKGIVTSNL